MTEVPPGWTLTTLGDVARWGSGGTPKASDARYYGGDLPWAVIGDLNDGVVRSTVQNITPLGLAESSAKVVPEGAVLVAMYGSIGKLGIAGLEMATNQAIAFAVPDLAVLDRDYLFHYLLAQRHELGRAGKGATQQNIGQGVLKAWPICFPSLQEQRRIVGLLENHLSRLDAAVAMLEGAARRAEAMYRGSLWQLTHGAGGDEFRLDQVADVRLGRQRSPSNHNGTSMRSYLRAGNVDWDRLRLDDIKQMNFTTAEEATFQLEQDDILVVEASGSAGEVGKSALYRGEAGQVCFQNTLLRVRCHAVGPEFMQKYLLAEAMNGRFLEGARGVGIHHIGRARLASWPVLRPAPEVQVRAVAAADAMATAKERLVAAIREMTARSAALRRALLAAAFSGRLSGASSFPVEAKHLLEIS